ncbi:hypothetical protein BN871_DW_00150 [Paenibacillus sp. P22]|nr:hypothetical protein BN871_DW_00150 [Paenibacillus sp. P22]
MLPLLICPDLAMTAEGYIPNRLLPKQRPAAPPGSFANSRPPLMTSSHRSRKSSSEK